MATTTRIEAATEDLGELMFLAIDAVAQTVAEVVGEGTLVTPADVERLCPHGVAVLRSILSIEATDAAELVAGYLNDRW